MGLFEQIKSLQEQLTLVIDASQQIADESFAAGKEEGIKSRDEEVAALKLRISELESSSGKIYSQEEADALVKAAVDPLQSQIDGLKLEVEDLKSKIEGARQEGMTQGKLELKASLKAEYLKQQVAENEGETGFGSLLD